MTNIFEYDDYRSYLRALLQESQVEESSVTSQVLAQVFRIQGPAVSKILNGTLNLDADKAFLFSRHFRLSQEEEAYFSLLCSIENTSLQDRKNFLIEQRIEIQRQQVKTPKGIEAIAPQFRDPFDHAEYYANPWAPIVHIHLTISKYQINPDLIGEHIGLSKGQLDKVFSLLERVGLIRALPQGGFAATHQSVHAMDFSSLPRAQQILLRAISLERLSSQDLADRYGLSVTFSTDPETHEKCRQLLVSCVSEIHRLVQASGPQEVYQLTLDLFPWRQRTS